MRLSMLKHSKHRSRGAAQALDLPPIGVEKRNDSPRGIDGLIRGVLHAGEKELQPTLPVSSSANAREEIVVRLPVRFNT